MKQDYQQVILNFGRQKLQPRDIFVGSIFRFFVQRGPRYGNPEAGTVVDNTVTCPERYDFFLVSFYIPLF